MSELNVILGLVGAYSVFSVASIWTVMAYRPEKIEKRH